MVFYFVNAQLLWESLMMPVWFNCNKINCHIWNGQQLNGYGIFEFRFRNHKIKLRVFRLKMYIHNGCRAIDTVQYMFIDAK
jgi:hypothetical protein